MWLIQWLTDWLTDWLIDWLIDWLKVAGQVPLLADPVFVNTSGLFWGTANSLMLRQQLLRHASEYTCKVGCCCCCCCCSSIQRFRLRLSRPYCTDRTGTASDQPERRITNCLFVRTTPSAADVINCWPNDSDGRASLYKRRWLAEEKNLQTASEQENDSKLLRSPFISLTVQHRSRSSGFSSLQYEFRRLNNGRENSIKGASLWWQCQLKRVSSRKLFLKYLPGLCVLLNFIDQAVDKYNETNRKINNKYNISRLIITQQ